MWIRNDAYNCFEPFEQQTTLDCFWICIIERVIIILFKYIYCRWFNNATNRVIQQIHGDVADDVVDDKRNTWKGYLIFNDCNWMVDCIGWDGMTEWIIAFTSSLNSHYITDWWCLVLSDWLPLSSSSSSSHCCCHCRYTVASKCPLMIKLLHFISIHLYLLCIDRLIFYYSIYMVWLIFKDQHNEFVFMIIFMVYLFIYVHYCCCCWFLIYWLMYRRPGIRQS